MPLSDERFAELCSENDPLRLERDEKGAIIVMSPSFSEGGSVELDVAGELRTWAMADGRGRHFGPSAGFTLPDTSVRAADAAWVSWQRWNALTTQQQKSFAPVCPEFVIEVRSETDRLKDARGKMEMWVRNRVELAWFIDPQRRVVEVYCPGDEPSIHENPTSVQGIGPVRGFELVMSRVWGAS